MSCPFYLFGMPSSLFINHNPTEIITAYLCDCFIILENKKRAEALLPIQLNYLGSIISVVGKTTVEIIELFKCTQKVP